MKNAFFGGDRRDWGVFLFFHYLGSACLGQRLLGAARELPVSKEWDFLIYFDEIW